MAEILALIDYGAGNLHSVANALKVAGADSVHVTADADVVRAADRIVLPAFTQEKLGELDTELIEHWFHSIGQAVGITLHIELLYGTNNHHICEAIFKGFARAMRTAVELDLRKGDAVPSTKGQLGG